MTKTAPYGSWRSPITAELLVEKAVRLGQVVVVGGDVYWNEGRPDDGGRQVVVRRRPDGSATDVVPPGFGARTLVHEYGGQSYAVAPDGSWLVFANLADQRLYRVELTGDEVGAPVALTAEPPTPMGVRFADPVVSPDGMWVVCIREQHLGPTAVEVVNDVVTVPVAGGEVQVLADGRDFFAAPRLSPDGASLCWLTWDHPNMPWDGTELWVAPFADGAVGPARRVAGGVAESISQPRWSPEGVLHHVSDRTGWWNLYRGDDAEPVAARDAEFSGPDWSFGQSTYDFLASGELVAVWTEGNVGHLGIVGHDGALRQVETPLSSIVSVRASTDGIACIAASPATSGAVVRIALPSGDVTVLRRSREVGVDPAYLSVPEPIEFPAEEGVAHAFFYPPANADHVAPEGELPPLIVLSHGGPTGASDPVLDLGLQFWTSRGFAVVDVNYGGSTGYGRAYRDRLQGQWGIVDVDDCVAAAEWLAAQGRVDADRLVIRGGSAGGYTTLAALTFRDIFAAGASHYGVADVEALARDTHKFESRYLDGLVGPYPAARDVYVERSPIHHTERLDRPMILFQGLEDKVVPPAQAEMMAAALREKGIPFAHLAFAGEQHGFRQSATIVRVAEAELWFYGRVLGFVPADEIEPVAMEHEDALATVAGGGAR